MNENRKIAKNSGILYVRMIIISVIGLFSSRLVLQYLGETDFGIYSVVGGIVVIMSLLNTAMISTSFRFIAFEIGKGDIRGVNRIFNVSLALHLGLAGVVIVLAATVGNYYIHHFLNVPADRVADAAFVFRLSVLATICSIATIPYQGLVTAYEKFSVRSGIEISLAFLRLAAAIALIYFGARKLRLYAVLTTVAGVVTSMMYIVYCRYKYPDIVAWKLQKKRATYKEMAGFSGWIFLGAAASIGKVQGTMVIINWFFGALVNAPFAIANQVNQMILMFTQNLGQAAIPQITKSYSSGNSERTIQLVFHMTKYSFFLMLLPALPILLETEFILNLWLAHVPKYTVIFCQLLIWGALIECLNAAIPAAVQATGKIKTFQIISSVISLSALPLAYYFFKRMFPPSTILVIFMMTALINTVVNQILLRNLIHYDVKGFFKVAYSKIAVVSICMLPLLAVKRFFNPGWPRFIGMTVLSTLWFAAAVYFFGLQKYERSAVKSGYLHIVSKLFPKAC